MLNKKDKRTKGCINPECKKCKKHFKYTADDNYCSVCKSELVFICPKCGGRLEDIGRKHTVCFKCTEEKRAKVERRKENAESRKEAVASVISAAAAVGNVAAGQIKKAKAKKENED